MPGLGIVYDGGDQNASIGGGSNLNGRGPGTSSGLTASLLQQLTQNQGVSSGGSLPGVKPTSAPPTANSAAANPVSNSAIDKLNARAADPTMGVGAYDLGIQKIRANASKGIAADAASEAARGVAGTGISDVDARGRAQNQEAQVGSLTANFLANRESARDALLGQAGNMGLAQGAQQQEQQRINYGQYNADRDAAYRETTQQTSNLNNILSLLSGSGVLGSGSNLAF